MSTPTSAASPSTSSPDAGVSESESSGSKPPAHFNAGFNAAGADLTKGHEWIMFRAITELTTRGLLPSQMTSSAAQKFLYYGADFADHVWDGPPEAATTPFFNQLSAGVVSGIGASPVQFEQFEQNGNVPVIQGLAAGNPVAIASCDDVNPNSLLRCNHYAAGGIEDSFDLIPVHVDIATRVGIGNGANGPPNVLGTPFTSALLAQDPPFDLCAGGGIGFICPIGYTNYDHLELNQPVRNSVAMLLRTYVRPWADLVLGVKDLTPIIKDFGLDNLFHYSLSDLAQFATPGSDPTISTAVITYPLLPQDIPDPPIASDDIKSWIIQNFQYQPAIGGTGYGAPTYGSVLFQLARKFFEGSVAAPSITELPKAGNDIDGWHTGGQFGKPPLQNFNLSFPHTYLGGNPFLCAPNASTDLRDPCATNPPTWPIWVLAPGTTTSTTTCSLIVGCITTTDVSGLSNPTPARSNRVALIYLGWASHMIQDLALPHHASNWTSEEHQRQDDLGDKAALSDLQGQIDWAAEVQSDLDEMLQGVTPDNVDTFCAQQSLGRSEITNGSLNWQAPYPAFVQQAANAFSMRQSSADLTSINTSDFQTYGKPILRHAIVGTVKLLLCAAPLCPGGGSCSGHGTCNGSTCACAAGYSGADCSVTCPGGPTCSGNGTCSGSTCTCAAGFSGADCSVTCPGGPTCSGNGTCNGSTCTCAAGFSGADCSVTCPGGPTCSFHGACLSGTCICVLGWSGADCSATCPGGPTCSGHGACNGSTCTCAAGFSGADCSVTCPGGPTCSGHGTCNGSTCSCATGFSGADCSVTCPGGPTCSGHGTCTNGTCACARGFTGTSCSVNCASGSTCPTGTGCNLNADCASRTCTGNVCVAPSCAPHCNQGTGCGASTDCGSGVCTNGVCQPPACSPTCAPGAKCGVNADCASRVCGANNTCSAPSCSPNCNTGASCGANGDCLSRVCSGGLCRAPACSPRCASGAACGTNADCTSQVCTAGKCR
jgi:hypothetical protein